MKYTIVICASCLLLLAGCSNFGYYSQAIFGHMNITAKLEPIDELIANPHESQQLREKLIKVVAIRRFASDQLGLPDNASYTSYADLERPYVLWNVVAAPEFSLDPRQWCFVFAGCVQYRGYFSEQAAKDFAKTLRSNGDDVHIGGVAAYSTLGLLEDPVLNTFIDRDDIALAGLIFHELAHQQLYVKNDSAFNEGFAKTVEIEGVRRWLSLHNAQNLMSSYVLKKQRHAEFLDLVATTSNELKALYASASTDEVKRDQKGQIIDSMRIRYKTLRASWRDYKGYDRWFEQDINNAKLAAINTYRDYVPAFQKLLEKQQGDLTAFYEAARKLGELNKDQRTLSISSMATSD